jgi:hypothetical protein
MTKAYLKLPKRPVSYAPRISSRRLGYSHQGNFRTQCYADDAPTAEEVAAENKLLDKIENRMKAVLAARGLDDPANATDADKLPAFMSALRGLNIDALRKIDEKFDADKVLEGLRNLAAKVDAFEKNKGASEAQRQERAFAIRQLLKDEKTMEKIQRAFEGKQLGNDVVLNCRAAVVMTTGTVVTDGDIPEDILNSFSVDAFIRKRRPQEFIWEIVSRRTVAKITEYKTWLEEGTEDGAFAIVAEGAVKPLVSKTIVRNTTKYRKIAGKRVYTEEFKKFREEIFNILEDLFNDQLQRNYNAILVTSLNTWAATYVGTAMDNQYDAPTDYHAIGAVAAQIEALDFVPDLLIINPQDKWRIGLQQATDGHFFIQVPFVNANGMLQLFGFRVYTSNRVTVGNFYLGESGLYKIEDEPVTIRMGYGIEVVKDAGGVNVVDVSSDFDNNRFRIIAETYFHNYVGTSHAGSWVYANFNTVKAALLAP